MSVSRWGADVYEAQFDEGCYYVGNRDRGVSRKAYGLITAFVGVSQRAFTLRYPLPLTLALSQSVY